MTSELAIKECQSKECCGTSMSFTNNSQSSAGMNSENDTLISETYTTSTTIAKILKYTLSGNTATSTTSNSSRADNNIPRRLEKPTTYSILSNMATYSMIQELYKNAHKIPRGVVLRLASDIWTHLKQRPKKPSWDIQTTVIMAILQALRDQFMSNSLEFWRLMLMTPDILSVVTTPFKTNVVPETVSKRRRNLLGLLKPLDEEETNSYLEAEWITSIHENQTKSSTDSGSSKEPLLLLEVPATPSLSKGRTDEKIVLYLHGGGFFAMSARTHRRITCRISKVTKRRVLAVNYRLAPETKFPGALFDAVQTFLHLIDINEKHKFKPENIILMGDSAGGGLCLSTMLYLRDHNLPLPEAAVLLSPWVDLTYSYPSWQEAGNYDYLPSNPSKIPILNPARLYLSDIEMSSHPYVSPLFADNFQNLPPMLIQSGSCECLNDEIVALVEKIKQAKSTIVHHEIYEDMVHAFQVFPFPKSEEAVESIGWWVRFGLPFIDQYKPQNHNLSVL